MLRRTNFPLLLLAFIFLLSACATPGMLGKNQPAGPDALEIRPPDLALADARRQPAHVKFVLAALINRIRGRNDRIREVDFDPDGEHLFLDKDADYEGFVLTGTVITGFQLKNRTRKRADLYIEGLFHFKDPFGRHITNYFAADYTVKRRRITIHKSAIALVAPSYPDVQAFIVPKSAFLGIDKRTLSSYMDLYVHALSHAYDPSAPSASPSPQSGDYFVLVFCKDRLPDYAYFEVRASKTPEMGWRSIADVLHVNDRGWRLAILGRKSSPNILQGDFYVHALYNPNSTSQSRTIRVATFVNQRKQTNPPTVAMIFQPGPVNRLLNPKKKEDAMLIQIRLKELGYYSSKIDGIFGRGSRKALRKFKRDHNLGNNSRWNAKTQEVLFGMSPE